MARIAARLERAAWIAAIAGGGLFLTIVMLTLVSVIGRTLFDRPLPGDYELVEGLTAIAIFAVLPWCQWRGGQVAVEIVSDRLSPPIQRFLVRLGHGLFGAVALFMLWRLCLGMIEAWRYGAKTQILGLPEALLFVAVLPPLALWAAVAFYRARHPVTDEAAR